MNKKFLIGLAAAAAAGYYFLIGKKQAIENLEIAPVDIAINSTKTNLLKLVFNLKLKVTNNSNATVKISSIDLDILVNNRKISEFQKNIAVTIAPKKTEIVLIEIGVQNLSIIDTVLNLLSINGNITARIIGAIKTDLGIIIVNYTKNIK
jgi:hypothetical protein